MILILAAAMTLQWPDEPKPPPALEFARAVEESVAAEPGTAPPAAMAALIARLGSPEWTAREAASKALLDGVLASPGDARWLFWGRVHRDPEIRCRSNAILRRLNPCGMCKGSGKSKNWELWPCGECDGTATSWPWSMWD